MSLPLLIIGAGGHGRVLADLAVALDRQVLGFLDLDTSIHGREFDGIKVLGGDDCLADYSIDSVSLVNGLGSIAISDARRMVYLRLKDRGYRFATLCHPGASLGRSVILGDGAQVMAGSIVQNGSRVGENSILNSGSLVEHDCVIGAHTHLGPGATLCGGVRVGEDCHIGVGAVVVQGVSVGNGVLVAAGAVVVGDLTSGVRVAGVPARNMESR
jgi:sugar O-acyltransferase (sialic acid O-acetyltransferase NeuD family)